ncbi:MAG: thiamine phosphate synthase [Vibrio sp.]
MDFFSFTNVDELNKEASKLSEQSLLFDVSKIEAYLSLAKEVGLNPIAGSVEQISSNQIKIEMETGNQQTLTFNLLPVQRSKGLNICIQDGVNEFDLVALFSDKQIQTEVKHCRAVIQTLLDECFDDSANRANIIRDFICWFLVAYLCDFPIEDSVVVGHAGVKQSFCVSRETWPDDVVHFPDVLTISPEATSKKGFKFLPLVESDMGLYPVVDSVEWIELLLQKGVKTIQLRIKNQNEAELEAQIQKSIELGRKHKAQVFINDYWQLAIKHQAYGVHLGQEDLSVADLDAIQAAGLRLGLSTHDYFEILRAKQFNPSYIALGHIFPTTTKVMPSKPQGLARLALYQKLLNHDFPTVAIGGIDLTNARQVWQIGVSSLAVVRAITEADDIQLALDSFNQIFDSTPRENIFKSAQPNLVEREEYSHCHQ